MWREALEVALDQQPVVAEGAQRLAPRRAERLRQLGEVARRRASPCRRRPPPPSAAAAARRSAAHSTISSSLSRSPLRPGRIGTPAASAAALGRDLVAEQRHRLRPGADEDQPGRRRRRGRTRRSRRGSRSRGGPPRRRCAAPPRPPARCRGRTAPPASARSAAPGRRRARAAPRRRRRCRRRPTRSRAAAACAATRTAISPRLAIRTRENTISHRCIPPALMRPAPARSPSAGPRRCPRRS